MNTKTEQNSSGMEAVVATDHPDLVGGIVWSRIELEWINKRLSDAGAIIAQKDAEILDQCRINGMGAEREAALLGQVAQQSSALKLAREALGEVQDLIGESHGVYGLHLNGDESPWGELEQGGRFERLTSLNEALAAINEVLKGE